MASNGFRPALLFLSSSGVSTTASISARKLSHGTRRSMASSGSPLADKASKRLSASKNPSCPIVASANQNLTHQIRTGREKQLFFDVPLNQIFDGDRFDTSGKVARVAPLVYELLGGALRVLQSSSVGAFKSGWFVEYKEPRPF